MAAYKQSSHRCNIAQEYAFTDADSARQVHTLPAQG